MQWFLVALSFGLGGEGPEMAARPVCPGPVAMVACQLEIELHKEIGTTLNDIVGLDAPELYCLDLPRLCAVQPSRELMVLAEGQGAGSAVREWNCRT